MFERYTERARRALFFSRYEATALGGTSIETEHLLLGLLRESKGLPARIFALADVSPATLRAEVEARTRFNERLATSVEIPFSEQTARALKQTAIEADRLEHSYIGAEHLLLGLLHDPTTAAGSILAAHGVTHDEALKQIRVMLAERQGSPSPTTTRTEVIAAIDQIKRDVSQLASLVDHGAGSGEVVEPFELADRIRNALDRLKPPRDE